MYQFTCFPKRLSFCPRKFTKLLKPVYSTLRMKGHLSVAYIDDSYSQAADYALCSHNIADTLTLFNKLGFVVHPEKSVLYPTQRLVFLGFVLDSVTMKVFVTPEKANNVETACQQLLLSPCPSIREESWVYLPLAFLG